MAQIYQGTPWTLDDIPSEYLSEDNRRAWLSREESQMRMENTSERLHCYPRSRIAEVWIIEDRRLIKSDGHMHIVYSSVVLYRDEASACSCCSGYQCDCTAERSANSRCQLHQSLVKEG